MTHSNENRGISVGDKYKILNAPVMGLQKEYRDGDVVEIVKVEGNTGLDKYGYVFPGVWVGTCLEPVSNIEGFKSDVKITLKRWRTSNQVSGTHYSDLVVEPLDLAYLNDLDASQVKVLKYIMRHKTKGGADDVRKAIDVCQKILQYEYGFGRE